MTDRKLFHGLVPITALTALAVAGCGGSSSNSDASFISKVNSICRSNQAQIDALGKPAGSTLPDLVAFLKKELPIAQAQDASIKAVKPPSDKAADFTAAIANGDQQVALVQQVIADGDAGNKAAFTADVGKVSTLQATGDALATKIGVTDCVSKSGGGSSSSSSSTTTT